MPSTRTAVRPTMDLRIALLLLLDLSPRPPRALPGGAGLYGCHARLVQAAEPICSRCQGRSKMHPFAPVENASPLFLDLSVCGAGVAGPGWAREARECGFGCGLAGSR